MQHECLVQIDADPVRSVRSLLANNIQNVCYSHMYAAMAYVTIAGVRDILALVEVPPEVTLWLIGLDDAVTQPGAIDLCRTLPGSEVRVASFEHEKRRFHPKLLYLRHNDDRSSAIMMIGSANLTKKALCGNAESVVVLGSETPAERAELDQLWQTAWGLGCELSEDQLRLYRDKYNVTKKYRRRALGIRQKTQLIAKPTVKVVLDDDQAEVDPLNATTCWIECGNVTAMGRELEFKAEQGLFFGLNPHGEPPKYFNFVVSDGQTVSLRMKYQGNHMWRLQMTREVPEVAQGLRPTGPDGRLLRSPWIATFVKTPEHSFRLTFVAHNSKAHLRLRRQSVATGTYGRTSTREYGWF